MAASRALLEGKLVELSVTWELPVISCSSSNSCQSLLVVFGGTCCGSGEPAKRLRENCSSSAEIRHSIDACVMLNIPNIPGGACKLRSVRATGYGWKAGVEMSLLNAGSVRFLILIAPIDASDALTADSDIGA